MTQSPSQACSNADSPHPRSSLFSSGGLARLGVLLVGLGIGTSLGFGQGIASADGLDFQISIDGYDLLPTADDSATATSGMGDMAIAFGNGAQASASGGIGDFSFADGNLATAISGGVADSNYDTAVDIGNNTGELHLAFAGTGDNDTALIFGPNGLATSGGDILDSADTGNNDTALILDPFGAGGDQVDVGVLGFDTGNNDFGAILFDDNALSQGAAGADYLYQIITEFGTETNAAAAMATDWWAELMALL